MKLNFNKIDKKMRKIAENVKLFKIDFSFILLLLLAFVLDEIKLYFFHVLFVVLHELSHFLMSKKLGYLPQKLHLTFFGASLEGDDDFLLEDEIKVVLAGPLFNLSVIILCYLCYWFEPETYIYLYDIQTANWSIFLFNMLPIFPLDAGRLLLVLFNKKYNRKVALQKTKKVSSSIIFILFILFLVSFFFVFNFMLGFVCVNLANLLLKGAKDTSYKRQLFVSQKVEKLSKGLIERTVYIDSSVPYFKLYKYIDDYHFFKFVFIDKNNKVTKTLLETELYSSDKLL